MQIGFDENVFKLSATKRTELNSEHGDVLKKKQLKALCNFLSNVVFDKKLPAMFYTKCLIALQLASELFVSLF